MHSIFALYRLQYMRTKGIHEKSIEVVQEKNNADLSRIWVPLSAIFAQRVAFSLFLDRRRKVLTLIDNRTGVPFIQVAADRAHQLKNLVKVTESHFDIVNG